MRLVYTSDMHGNAQFYTELLDLALQRDAEAVIVGGDLLARSIKRELAIDTQRAFVFEQLRPLLEAFRRARPGVDVYLLPGNDDWAGAIAALDQLEQDGLARLLHQRVYCWGGSGNTEDAECTETTDAAAPSSFSDPSGLSVSSDMFVAGYACVPITPFSIKDYERRDQEEMPVYSFAMAYRSGPPEPGAPGGRALPITPGELAALPSIAEDLAALARRSPPERTIYVCHVPPYGTDLDAMRGRHAGSVALHRFIELHQPPLTLHGHIHESPRISGHYAARIGATWCLNPGNDGARLHAIVLDTDDVATTTWHTIYGGIARST